MKLSSQRTGRGKRHTTDEGQRENNSERALAWPANFMSNGGRLDEPQVEASATPKGVQVRRHRGRRTAKHRQELVQIDPGSQVAGSVWAKYEEEPASVDRFQVLPGPPSGPLALTALPGPQTRLTAQLQIDSLSSEDNGIYSCQVDFRKARSRTQVIELKIISKWFLTCLRS